MIKQPKLGFNPSPVLKSDFYKQGHRPQYPEGTTLVCSNGTARGTYLKDGTDKIVLVGNQVAIQMMHEDFALNFFNRSKEDVVKEFKRRLDTSLGSDTDVEHIEYLHDLGYLPLTFWGLPEGSRVDLRVPNIIFWNTDPKCFWLTNFIETEFSCNVWPMSTSATTADKYKKILIDGARKTNSDMVDSPDKMVLDFPEFQGHDFSYRGMFGSQAAWMSGIAHLTSFRGTDTITAIEAAEHYYDADADKELVGTSVDATEHSVSCMGIADYTQQIQDGVWDNELQEFFK